MGFLDPAPAVSAAAGGAGVIGAALADFAEASDGDLPGRFGTAVIAAFSGGSAIVAELSAATPTTSLHVGGLDVLARHGAEHRGGEPLTQPVLGMGMLA